jgi:excisionase family DNA binding protein
VTKRLEDRELASAALVALRRWPKRFTLPNGARVHLPKVAVDGLIEMLDAVAEGDIATVVCSPREMSTQQAATVLNVSRPTVVKLIDDGVLPSRKVRSHRRIALTDLLAYRDDMVARRRAVLDLMSRDAEELGSTTDRARHPPSVAMLDADVLIPGPVA